jgi:hypothetical protein
MNAFKTVSLSAAVALIGLTSAASRAQTLDNIGAAPDCPYGYYDYSPYDCAPYGYYGPEWFAGGLFIGAGPWFHGHDGFRGRANHHFDVHGGYRGPLPGRGERPNPSNPLDRMEPFSGTHMHDGLGHVSEMGGHEGGGHEGGGHEGGGRR